MDRSLEPALLAFHRAASQVPAYLILLTEAGIRPQDIRTRSDFARLPILDKASTFQRFPVEKLCVDGQVGALGSVLTSSGHSGIFAFGLNGREHRSFAAAAIDDALDQLFDVRSRRTLLVNCLPMGVRVPTDACTLAETSVRPDMVVGLVRAFAHHFDQLILVGETAFIKHTLELGRDARVDWPALPVQVIVGEEPLAENARKYLEAILGSAAGAADRGIVASSMGVAEFGLNLLFEMPPRDRIIPRLRRLLHEERALRHQVIGPADWVPSLFTYDPRRVEVEFTSEGRMLLTTLDPQARVPLIRYAPGDYGSVLHIPAAVRPDLENAGISCDELDSIPIIAVLGRGEHALAGRNPVYPEAVKEGLYHDPALARQITANFRLLSGPERARVRVQCAPGVTGDEIMEKRFSEAIGRYVTAPVTVSCEAYGSFGSGMTLDYERKFNYLKR